MCTAHRVRASGCNYAAPVVCIYGLNTNRKFEFKYVRRQQFVRKVCCGGRHEVGSLQWLHAQRIDRSLCMQSIRKYLRVLVSLNASPFFFKFQCSGISYGLMIAWSQLLVFFVQPSDHHCIRLQLLYYCYIATVSSSTALIFLLSFS